MKINVAIPLALIAFQASGETLLLPTDRVLFAGDSITGHSMNLADGYCNQMTWALKQVHPASTNILLALGGSGQGVGSWMSVATYTNATPSYLDVPGIEVRTTLDAGTDVLVIMLGMNDLLSPYIADTPDGRQAWRGSYTNLIRTLRARTHPRLTALGTVTLLTEDFQSPKNIARDKLNQQVAEIAAAEGCLVFQTGEGTSNLLQRGRALTPEFHVASDFVHPGTAGHAAIAMAMLNGLGESDAAQLLEARYLSALIPTNSYPALSYGISAASRGSDTQTNTYTITYWWTAGQTTNPAPTVTLSLPATWHLDSRVDAATTGVFTVTGSPDRVATNLTLTASSGGIVRTQTIAVPTPWRISAGIPNQAAWPQLIFNPTNSLQAYDQPLILGAGFSAAMTNQGNAYPWTVYTPSVNYTGGNSPGSIDAFAILYGGVYDSLYATRWIYSGKARSVDLALSTSIFAGTVGLNVWMNSQSCYAAAITSEPSGRTTARASLRAGWNQLFIKCDHVTWQWQFACALSGQGADDLADLRYSAIPQTVAPDTGQAGNGTINESLATGGSMAEANGYMTHTFTNGGQFVVKAAFSAEVLVVAGGGGGGASAGGGGGAGGLIYTNLFLTPGTNAVTVGVGGVGAAGVAATDGSNSVFGALTAMGGGGGGRLQGAGRTGGSGGGGSGWISGSGAGGAGTSGQGGGGGTGTPDAAPNYNVNGGGGGGAGGPGGTGFATVGATGGVGVACGISGAAVWYAGGGGGGQRGGTGGPGGSGGGGKGGNFNQVGVNGTPYTGGGGGGGGYYVDNTLQAGGTGGCGVVIVRYRLPQGLVQATGGTFTKAHGYGVHTFTNSGTFVVTSRGEVEALLVAGGGGGGAGASGGGGAGGLVHTNFIVSLGTNTVTVGTGGSGGPSDNGMGVNGGDSVFWPLTASGGGGGGGRQQNGKSGGSGGGAGGWWSSAQTGGAGSSGQGNQGGLSMTATDYQRFAGGGGGGAGGSGYSATTNGTISGSGGNGGVGVASDISGTTVTYAGGGGGGRGWDTPGTGGSGGGGSGAGGPNAGAAGTPNTGGGGGGGGYGYNYSIPAWVYGAGGAGGSGIVIVRYLLPKGTSVSVK